MKNKKSRVNKVVPKLMQTHKSTNHHLPDYSIPTH